MREATNGSVQSGRSQKLDVLQCHQMPIAVRNFARILPSARRRWQVAGTLLLTALGLPGMAQTPPAANPSNIPYAPVPLPPMGWSSWNSFSNTIDAPITMAQAKALHSSGLQQAGYMYVNIDEGWWLGQRDAAGNIVVDPKAWPALAPGERAGDMSNIVRYIHSLGLRAGIYTDAGKDGCSMYPDIGPVYLHTGSEGHYEQDFLQFARWGFDYVKVDWCGGAKENLDPDYQYGEIARAIARAKKITGRTLYFSICEWGRQSPFTWAPGVGGTDQAIWRTSGDIVAPIVAGGPHASRKVSLPNILRNFAASNHPEAQHTGYYNDPDMMVFAMPGMTETWDRVHLALWAIAGAPMLVGADLTRLTPPQVAMLTNKRMIAIDQDPLGLQCIPLPGAPAGVELWGKLLARPGARALVVLNKNPQPVTITEPLQALGLAAGAAVQARDVWTGEPVAENGSTVRVTIPGGDARFLVIQGTDAAVTTYATQPERGVRGGSGWVATNVRALRRSTYARIVYANRSAASIVGELRVNGGTATKVQFPAVRGGDGASAYVAVEMALKTNAPNTLEITLPCSTQDVSVQSVQVLPW